MAPEPRCPFCGADLPMAPSPLARCGRVIMFGLSMALGTVGCGPGFSPDEPEQSEDSSGSATMTAPASSDGPVMTSGPQTSGSVSTGTDTTTEDTGVDDSEDQGGSFYAGNPDSGGLNYECDIFAQDCEEGEKCMPWASDGGGNWNATRCTPIARNPNQVGEACSVEGSGTSGIDDCALGLMCFGVDSKTNEGVCQDMCTGDESEPVCEEPGDACFINNDGALVLCLPTCDPVMQDCGEGEGCYPSNEVFFCVPSAGSKTMHGDSCEFINACAPGQLCLSGGGFTMCESWGCCSTVCALDDPDADLDCAALDAGQGCQSWYEEGMAPEGYENTGVCAVP